MLGQARKDADESSEWIRLSLVNERGRLGEVRVCCVCSVDSEAEQCRVRACVRVNVCVCEG